MLTGGFRWHLALKLDSNKTLRYFTIGIVTVCWADFVFGMLHFSVDLRVPGHCLACLEARASYR